MTVAELIEQLQQMNPDADVRTAQQPAWAFEYDVSDVVESVDDENVPVVYIAEGTQIGYLPETASSELGWR